MNMRLPYYCLEFSIVTNIKSRYLATLPYWIFYCLIALLPELRYHVLDKVCG